MATNLATAQGQDTFLLVIIEFVGLSRLRSPSRARWLKCGNVVFIYVSAVLFCSKIWGQMGTTWGQPDFITVFEDIYDIFGVLGIVIPRIRIVRIRFGT